MIEQLNKVRNGLLLALGATLAVGCSSGTTTSRPAQAIPVRTITVSVSAGASLGREYVGVVEEESATALSFPVQGTVSSLTAGEGQRVAQGQLLAKLDERNLQSVYNGARASLEQAEDAMKRLQQLYDNKSLPEIKYVEAQTKLEQARSMEEVARKNLDDSRLSAPFGGVIGQRQVETGENVLPGQTVYTLLKTDVVKIKIPVPENEISNIGSQSRARITVAALDGRTYEGTVQEKGVTANPVSHTYEAKIPLRNADGALMPGMVCRVTMESDSSARAIVLPNRAVQVTGRGERFVWCVRDGRAALVPVTVGALTETGVVVTGGLAGGEQVIVDGYQKVSDGMNVDVL